MESYAELADRLAAGDDHPLALGRRARRLLLGSIAVTLALHLVPLGGFVIYPLMLLSTLAHELGHGLVALAVGADFERLSLFADGSGVAQWTGEVGENARALIAAGGLLGPALVAAVGFQSARRGQAARVGVAVAGLALLVALVLVVRNAFGLVFVGLLVGGLGWLLVRRSASTLQMVLMFLSVQLALSVFSRADYLFTDTAVTGAGTMPSDVAHMAGALGGPYWLWGLACGLFSLLVLAGGVWLSLRGANVGASTARARPARARSAR